jgi:two-component system OmpR family response regulator
VRVLVVEDDSLVGDALLRALTGAGFAVDLNTSAEAARGALASDAFDLLVLDIGLPRESGLQLMASLRARGTLLPILMLTARDGVEDRVAALNLGADDYLIKPFEVAELVARCRALIRRANASPARLAIGPMQIDMSRKEVQVDGSKLELTHREWSILECLALNHGHIVSKERLMSAVASFAEDLTPNAIEVYVSRLRAKLGRGVSLRAVRGMGYTLGGHD